MKRILLVLMSVFMLAFLVGCGNDASKTTDSSKPSTSEKITIQAAASLKGALTPAHCVNKLNKVHLQAYSSLQTKKI